jgi:hypothetical protein
MRQIVLRARGGLLAPLMMAWLPACTGNDGLPWPSQLPPAQGTVTQATPDLGPTQPIPDLALPIVADLAQPDLASPPPTIQFSIVQFTGSGISGDTTTVSFPLPTPTTVPIDGIGYLYSGFQTGQYDTTLEWADQTGGNRGWTASFAGAPAVTPGWPIMSRRIQMGAANFGPDKVAIIGRVDAQPNTLIITIRSVTDPRNDYGILRQGIRGNRN